MMQTNEEPVRLDEVKVSHDPSQSHQTTDSNEHDAPVQAHLGNGIIAEDTTRDISDHEVLKGVSTKLYVSHFLSTWNSRSFEFGAVLFLASIFPRTLLPLSIYALVRSSSAIVLGPAIGSTIDRSGRLGVVRGSICMY